MENNTWPDGFDGVAGVYASAFVERLFLMRQDSLMILVSLGFMPQPSLSGGTLECLLACREVSLGFMPQPSLSDSMQLLGCRLGCRVSLGFMPQPSLSGGCIP